MFRFILIVLLMMPLCGSGAFENISAQGLYPKASMPIYACLLDLKHERIEKVVLIFAGEPKFRNDSDPGYLGLTLIDAMTTVKFYMMLEEKEQK